MKSEMKTKVVVGLMSGTSVDGIDACIVKIRPDLSMEIIKGLVYPYPENIRQSIFELFKQNISIEQLCWLNFVIGEYFSLAAVEVVKSANLDLKEIDLIGSHGQTIYHLPTQSMINGFKMAST